MHENCVYTEDTLQMSCTYLCSCFIDLGLSNDAAKYIVELGNVFGVGLDTASLDPGKCMTFNAHQTLLGAQIFGIENLKLEKDALPGKKLAVITSSLSHHGSSLKVQDH
jgi:kynurenine formamidase